MSSIPFAVQCQTCGSRLQVSDPSLIGTIASCPKCNSMVQIVPESNAAGPQVAVGTANVDSEAITEEAIDVGKDPDVDPAALPSGFASTPSVEATAAHDSIPSAVPPDWQSARTQRSRQIGLIVALSLSSLLAAVMLFGWFVRSWQGESTGTNTTAQANKSLSSTDANKVNETAADSSPNEPVPAESSLAEQPVADPSAPDPESTEASEDAANASPEVAEASSQESSPQVATEPDAVPSDLLPRSPLDPLAPQADMAQTDEDASTLERLPEGLQKFVPILDLGPQQQQATLEAPPALQTFKVEEAADQDLDPMLVATPPEPINLRRALAIEFAVSPANGKYPLSDLILLISQITGIPIQIDWVTFDLVGISIGDEIPVKPGWNSAGTLLDSIAESVGGVIEKSEHLLTLTPSDESKQERLAEVLDLTDFADGRASAGETLNQFLPWGDVNVSLQQESDQQKLAALAVEALRRVRGITPKVPDARFRRWAQPSAGDVLDWPLLTGGNAGPQYDAPLTVAGFLRRTARGNQATCFVNWFDANLRRMSPAQLIMPFTGATAGEVVADELKPFGLQARRVDEKHWWVGTQASYDRFPVIVWTGPLGADQAVLTQRLNSALASTSGGLFRMAIDPDTGCAVLLLPRYLVRQLPKIQNGLNLTKAR